MTTTRTSPVSIRLTSFDAVARSEVRPWGSWCVLDVGEGFKIKRISVAPHARLSLQTHQQRSEHWIVVAGVATCTVASQTRVLGTGARVDVPRGVAHRIANHDDEPLLLIEVQLGDYTGEDDIVRLEDDYGRCAESSRSAIETERMPGILDTWM